MTAKEIEKLLKAAGWQYKNTRGSHKHFVHPLLPGKVTVPQHKGDISIDTAKSILKMTGISEVWK